MQGFAEQMTLEMLGNENCKLHDPALPLLLGHVKPTGTVIAGSQRSFLRGE